MFQPLLLNVQTKQNNCPFGIEQWYLPLTKNYN